MRQLSGGFIVQGVQQSGGLFGSTAQPSLFGAGASTSTANTGLFGTTENKPLFGQTNTSMGKSDVQYQKDTTHT